MQGCTRTLRNDPDRLQVEALEGGVGAQRVRHRLAPLADGIAPHVESSQRGRAAEQRHTGLRRHLAQPAASQAHLLGSEERSCIV